MAGGVLLGVAAAAAAAAAGGEFIVAVVVVVVVVLVAIVAAEVPVLVVKRVAVAGGGLLLEEAVDLAVNVEDSSWDSLSSRVNEFCSYHGAMSARGVPTARGFGVLEKAKTRTKMSSADSDRDSALLVMVEEKCKGGRAWSRKGFRESGRLRLKEDAGEAKRTSGLDGEAFRLRKGLLEDRLGDCAPGGGCCPGVEDD